MAPWTAAASVQAGLTDFYTTMATTARDGLHAPLADLAAYRATAKAMLKVVDRSRRRSIPPPDRWPPASVSTCRRSPSPDPWPIGGGRIDLDAFLVLR